MSELTFFLNGDTLRLNTAEELLKRILPGDTQVIIDSLLQDPGNGIESSLEMLQSCIPVPYRFLLEKAALIDERQLSLLDYTRKRVRSENFGLQVGGQASLRINSLQHPHNNARSLLSFGLQGSFNFGASARAASGLLSMGINATSDNSRGLEYHVNARPGERVLESFLGLKSTIADPSNLEDILAAFDGSDLHRIVRRGRSSNTLGVSINLGRAFEKAYPHAGIDLAGNIGASLSVEYNDSADFSLVVEKTGDVYRIALDKARVNKSGSLLKLGVDVKLVGLRQGLLDKICVVLPEGEEARALIQRIDDRVAMLSEQKLKTALAEELSQRWPQAENVFRVLVGEQTTANLAAKIREELQEKIEDVLAEKVDLLNDDSAEAARTVASTVSSQLKLSDVLRDMLEDYIAAALVIGINDLQSSFASSAGDVLDPADIEALLRPLNDMGEGVSNVVALVSRGASVPLAAISGALKEVYARYSGFRKAVIAAVKQRFQEDFALAVLREKSRSETFTETLSVTFHRFEPALGELYSRLWNGDLRELQSLLARLQDISHAEARGEYIRSVDRLRSTGMDANIFGERISVRRAFSDSVAVGFDLSGRMIVAQSRGELAERFRGFGEAQTISATWSVDYLKRPLLDGPVTLSVEMEDKSFSSGSEVRDFFGPLVAAAAMRDGIVSRVETQLFDGHRRRLKNARLAVKVPLSWGSWLNLLERESPQAIAGIYLNWLKVIAGRQYRAAESYASDAGYTSLVDYLMDLGQLQNERKAYVNLHGGSSHHIPGDFRRVLRFAQLVRRLRLKVEAAQEAWSEVPRGADIAVDESRFMEKVQAFNEEFARLFSGVFQVKLLDAGDIHWRTAAAVAMFLELDTDGAIPNPSAACTISADNLDELVIS